MLKLSAIAVAAMLLAGIHQASAQQTASTVATPQTLAGTVEALLAPHFKPDAPGATVIVVGARGPRATGHTLVEKVYGPARSLSMTQPYAAGSLVSNVDDLAKWEAAIAGGKLLKPETWRKAFTPYTLASGEATTYGYGWHVGRLENAAMLSHGGGINGFRTHALRLPEQNLFVALLVNSDRGSIGIDELARKAAALAVRSSKR